MHEPIQDSRISLPALDSHQEGAPLPESENTTDLSTTSGPASEGEASADMKAPEAALPTVSKPLESDNSAILDAAVDPTLARALSPPELSALKDSQLHDSHLTTVFTQGILLAQLEMLRETRLPVMTAFDSMVPSTQLAISEALFDKTAEALNAIRSERLTHWHHREFREDWLGRISIHLFDEPLKTPPPEHLYQIEQALLVAVAESSSTQSEALLTSVLLDYDSTFPERAALVGELLRPLATDTAREKLEPLLTDSFYLAARKLIHADSGDFMTGVFRGFKADLLLNVRYEHEAQAVTLPSEPTAYTPQKENRIEQPTLDRKIALTRFSIAAALQDCSIAARTFLLENHPEALSNRQETAKEQ